MIQVYAVSVRTPFAVLHMEETPTSESLLQEYLKLKFLNIKEDEHLKKLKLASADLSAELKKDPGLLRAVALVAFDPGIGADNEVINTTQEIITKHWNTFAANAKTKAVTAIRAVMLEALKSLSTDEDLTPIIWSTLRNILSCYQLGPEKNYLTKLIQSLGDQIEAKTIQSWALAPSLKSKKSAAILISTELQKKIETAGQLQAETIAGLNESFKAIVAEIQSNQATSIKQMQLLQLRNQLLWWKVSSFSESTKKPYGELRPEVLTVALATDYSSFFNEMFPESANHILLQVHRSLDPESAKLQSISEILTLLDGLKEDLKPLLTIYSGEQEIKKRLTLIEFISGYVHGIYDKKAILKRVGIAPDMKISQNYFCLWLFHDLFTLKLCNQ